MDLEMDDDMAMDIYWQPTQIPCAGLDNIKRRAVEETMLTRPAPPLPVLSSGSSASSSFGSDSQSSQSSQSQSQRRPRGRPARRSTVPRTEAQIIMKQKMESLVVATVSGYLGSPPTLASLRSARQSAPARTSTGSVRDKDAMDVDDGSGFGGVARQRHKLPEREPAPRTGQPNRELDADAGADEQGNGGLLGMHPRRAAMHPPSSSSSRSSFSTAASSSAISSRSSVPPPIFRPSAEAAAPSSSSAFVAPVQAPAATSARAVDKPAPPKFVPTASQSRTAAKALGMRRPPVAYGASSSGKTSASSSSNSTGSGYRPFKPPLAPAPTSTPTPAPAPAPAAAPAPVKAVKVEPAQSVKPEDEEDADTSDTSFGSLGFDIDTIEAICSQYDRPVQRSV